MKMSKTEKKKIAAGVMAGLLVVVFVLGAVASFV